MAECSGIPAEVIACNIGNGIGDVVGGAVKATVLSPLAKELMDGFDSFLKDFMTSWLGPGLLVDLDGVSVNWFKTSLNSITVALMVIGLMVAGIRIMMENRSAPLKEASKSFFQVIFIVVASTVLINALILGGDAYSKWILAESGTGVDQFGLQSGALLSNPGLALIVGIVGIFAVLIQWLIMLGRNAVLPLLVAFWPTAAAANLISSKSGVFEKVTAWILAFIIYKPLAASIYAFAWKLKAGDDGIAGVLNGVVLIVLAIMTMPALLRLLAPATAALGNASGGSMAATGGAALVAAGVAVGAMVATGGGSAAASGGGAAAKAGGKTAGASAPTGGGSAKGGPAATGGGPSPSGSPAPTGGGSAKGSDPAAPATGDAAGGGSPASTSPGTAPASGSSAQTPSGSSPASGSTPGAAPASGSGAPASGGGAAPASGSTAAGGGAPTPSAAPAGGAPAGAPPASGARSAGTGTRAAARIAEAGSQAARGINDQATRDGRD